MRTLKIAVLTTIASLVPVASAFAAGQIGDPSQWGIG
jgi:hypothetical protein